MPGKDVLSHPLLLFRPVFFLPKQASRLRDVAEIGQDAGKTLARHGLICYKNI